MGDEGWGGGGACFSLLTPSVCGLGNFKSRQPAMDEDTHEGGPPGGGLCSLYP